MDNSKIEQLSTLVKEAAVAKFGSEAAADEFMAGLAQGLEKAAAKQGGDDKPFDFTRSVSEGFTGGISNGLGKGFADMVTGSIIGGFKAIKADIGNSNAKLKYLNALERAIKMNHLLAAADRGKILSYGETIFKFAPHVAMDVNLLSSTLANAVHGEGIDPVTINMLIQMENKFIDTGVKKNHGK